MTTAEGLVALHSVVRLVFTLGSLLALLCCRPRGRASGHDHIPCPFDPTDAGQSKYQQEQLQKWPQFVQKLLLSRSLKSGYRLELGQTDTGTCMYIIQSALLCVLYLDTTKVICPLQAFVCRSACFADHAVLAQLYTSGLCRNTSNSTLGLPCFILCCASSFLGSHTACGRLFDALGAVAMVCMVLVVGTTLTLDCAHDIGLGYGPRRSVKSVHVAMAIRLGGLALDIVGPWEDNLRTASVLVNALATLLMSSAEQLARCESETNRGYTLLPIFTHQQARRLQIADGTGGGVARAFPEGYLAQIRRADNRSLSTFQARQLKKHTKRND